MPPNAQTDPGTHEALGKQVDRYQIVIDRLAATSRQIKTIAVALAGALGALAATTAGSGPFVVAAAAMGAFAVLDAYYLALERCARASQEKLVEHTLSEQAPDWHSLLILSVPHPGVRGLWSAARSPTIWLFYTAPGLVLLSGFLLA